MERAGRLIPKLKLSPEMADPETRARAAWALAAGETIARHTRAASLVRGTLIIEVEDYTWQRNLAGFESSLLRNLREALGEATVASLDFRPMRKPAVDELPPRRQPQRAQSARPDSDLVGDPVLDWLYRQSKAK
jgi:predicted nucleic acid-binding Zn ribbon protein